MKIKFLFYFLLILSSKTEKFSANQGTNNLRNLQNSISRSPSTTIYYTPGEKFNNFTGTREQLKDEAYRAICLSLNCISHCCKKGEASIMICANHGDCNNNASDWTIITMALIFYFVYGYLIIFIIISKLNRNKTLLECMRLALLFILGIAFFPITLIILMIRFCLQISNRPEKPSPVSLYHKNIHFRNPINNNSHEYSDQSAGRIRAPSTTTEGMNVIGVEQGMIKGEKNLLNNPTVMPR
jgi:hypothetical protein